MPAIRIRPDGTSAPIDLKPGKDKYTFYDLTVCVGIGRVDVHNLPNDFVMMWNAHAPDLWLPRNHTAITILRSCMPSPPEILGDVVVFSKDEIEGGYR